MRPFEEVQRLFNKTALEDNTILSGQFWGELRVFLAVAKAKSFSRAAEILNMSQPTVSRRAKRLQDLVGSQLFVPTQQGVRLTEHGEALAKALVALDQSLFAITLDLQSHGEAAEGTVRVSVTDGLNAIFVAPSLQAFSTKFPGIRLELKSPGNMLNLRDNQTDMMVGFVPSQSAEVMARRLGSIHFIPFASNIYIQTYGLPAPDNLEHHHFLQSEYYTAKTGVWDSWNAAVSRGRIAHACDNSFAYAMLAKSGLGIALLGSYTVMDPLAVPVDIEVKAKVPIYLHVLKERLNSPPVRVVYDWLSEVFSEKNPWLSEEFQLGIRANDFDENFRRLFNIVSSRE
jgi:DNA-binding transcriptional LysR family regulator